MHIGIIGSGYLGLALCLAWQGPDTEVTVTTTREEKAERLSSGGFQVEVLDGGRAEEVRTFVEDKDVLVICVAPTQEASYEDTYLATARTVASVIDGSPVQHIFYTGSTSVYGDHAGATVTEESSLNASSPSAKVLVAAEQALTAIDHCPVTILRIAGIIGPERKFSSRPVLPGTGDARINLVHRDDIVRATLHLFNQQKSGIYNICWPKHPTRREYYTALAEHAGVSPPTFDSTLPSRHGGSRIVSSDKLLETGFSFMHDIRNPNDADCDLPVSQ